MEKSKINLNHFEFKIIKNKSSDRLQTIAVTSKALYEKLYKDVSLDYIFQSESKFTNIDSQNNIIINKINTTQERSLIATIHARLKRAIKDKEESEPKSDNLDDLFSDDFDFSELDEPQRTEDIPILNDFVGKVDEFDFSELDEPEPASDFTYSCPKCKSGILRAKTISGDKFHWTCVNTTKCNSVFADFRGRPIGEDLNDIAEIAVDENTSVSNDDFDFDDDVLCKDFNSEKALIDPKHLNDDFNFDEFDETEPTPNIVGNDKPAETVFPKDFDFEKLTDSLVAEILQYEKESYDTYKESQRILQLKNELQLQYENLEKRWDWLNDKSVELQREFEHAIRSQFKTK
jgi:hypothetical protein